MLEKILTRNLIFQNSYAKWQIKEKRRLLTRNLFFFSQRKIFNKKPTNQTLVTVNSEAAHFESLLQLQHNNDINKNYSKNFIEPESLSIPEDGRINYSTNRAQVHHGSKHVVKMLGAYLLKLLLKAPLKLFCNINKTKKNPSWINSVELLYKKEDIWIHY